MTDEDIGNFDIDKVEIKYRKRRLAMSTKMAAVRAYLEQTDVPVKDILKKYNIRKQVFYKFLEQLTQEKRRRRYAESKKTS